MGKTTLTGRVAVDGERFVPAAKNSAGEKRKQKEERHSSGHVTHRSSDKYPLALLHKVYGCETKKRVFK